MSNQVFFAQKVHLERGGVDGVSSASADKRHAWEEEKRTWRRESSTWRIWNCMSKYDTTKDCMVGVKEIEHCLIQPEQSSEGYGFGAEVKHCFNNPGCYGRNRGYGWVEAGHGL
jgi:hypothetical protein